MKADKTAYPPTIGIVLGAASILLLPLLAMQTTDEVNWGPVDFAVAGALLVGTGLLYQLAARKASEITYRAAAGVALAAALLLVWINLAVGIIGDDGNPANLMYIGVLAVSMIGATLARFRPSGMARALFATALAPALVAVIAVFAGFGGSASAPLEIFGINALFVALWVGAASLFRHAAREQQASR